MVEDSSLRPFVRLVSSDGFEYIVSREAAMISGTIRSMISSGDFEEAKTNLCRFPETRSYLLEKACEYLYFNLKYRNAPSAPDFEPPPELALELLVTADFLDGITKVPNAAIAVATPIKDNWNC